MEGKYIEIITKLRNIDYTRLCDYDTIYYRNFMNEFKNIPQINNLPVMIRVEKKNLSNQL